jgi:hypothetical protein
MPWCPRCDETFPEGPACPRCSARLVARERETPEDTLSAVPGLQAIKVSRRYLRAFERLSAPKASSSRALALALVLLVFATGFLLGRVGSVPVSQPTVQALPPAKPLIYDDVKGSVAYLLGTNDPLMTIAIQTLDNGTVVPRARFSPVGDIAIDEEVTTRVVSFGRSAAVVLADAEHAWVAFAPQGRAAQGWIPGGEVAWASETEILIRSDDSSLQRFQAGIDSMGTEQLEPADGLFQTSAGPVVRRGRLLETVNAPMRRLKLPAKGDVLAVSPDLSRALLDADTPVLWDGHHRKPVHAYDAGHVVGASFEPSGERAAIVLSDDGELTLAVVMPRGNAAMKPLGNARSCTTPPAWDGSGRWLYVATADGQMHAVEASGGRIEAIKTHGVGCGLAWLDIA